MMRSTREALARRGVLTARLPDLPAGRNCLPLGRL